MGDRIAEPAAGQSAGSGKPFSPVLVAVGLFLLIITGAGYYFTTKSIYTWGPPARKVRIIVRRMIVKAGKEGVLPPDTGGWVCWAGTLAEKRGENSGRLFRLVKLIHRGFFSGIAASPRDVRFIRRIYQRYFITTHRAEEQGT